MTDEVQFIAKPSFLRNHADVLVAAGLGLLMALTGMAILSSNLAIGVGGFLFLYHAIVAVVRWRQCLATTLTITCSKSILRSGVFETTTTEVRHQDVRSTTVTQTPWQRSFEVSTLHIASAGHAGVEISIAG